MRNTRNTVFLVFRTKGKAGERVGGREHVGHHKHTLVGVFVVFGTRGRGGDASDSKTRPCGACFGVREEEEGEQMRRT